MIEPTFFQPDKALTLRDVAALTGALPPDADTADRTLDDIAPLDLAGPSDLAFFDRTKFLPQVKATRAGACLVSKALASHVPAHVPVLTVDDPYRAFVLVAREMFSGALRPSSMFASAGLSKDANIHATARLEAGVVVDPGVVIGPNVEIGSGSVIGANAVLGPGVRVGRHCSIGAGVTLSHTLVGDRVIIHPGARIGQDGFGYVMGARHLKVPQVGRVIIQDDVEVGANTAIDRGGSRDTMIGEGTKIDNLCQIAHNVVVGRHCVVASQSGISGSVVVEDYVVMGGQVGIVDHIRIGAGAMIAAGSGVLADVAAGAKMGGLPATTLRDWQRSTIAMRRLIHTDGRTSGKGERE